MRKRLLKFGFLLGAFLVGTLSAWATDWTSTNSLPTSAGTYKLTKDVNISTTWTVSTNITLDLNDHIIKMTGSNQRVINLSSGTLTIQDNAASKTTRFWEYSGSNKWWTRKASGTSTYTTSGGCITGGNFSGEGNSSKFGAGILIASGATLNLNGGNVVGNNIYPTNGTGNGGGIYINGGTLTIGANAKVIGNGLHNDDSQARGAGIYMVSGTCTNNGEISYNIGYKDYTQRNSHAIGGGIMVFGDASFTNNGNISHNESDAGGGIDFESTGALRNYGEVSYNIGHSHIGGIGASGSDVQIGGTIIYNSTDAEKETALINAGYSNSRSSEYGYGAGISISAAVTLLPGVVIAYNTAKHGGAGLYHSGTSLNISGAITIKDNTLIGSGNPSNVTLVGDRVFTVTGALTGSAIGVNFRATPFNYTDFLIGSGTFTSGYGTANSAKTPNTYFFSDYASNSGSSFAVKPTTDGNAEAELVTGGSCGSAGHTNDLQWYVTGDSPNQTLNIYKSAGATTSTMATYSAGSAPWYSYRTGIKNLAIDNNVTTIGAHAFENLTVLSGINISANITSIGTSALKGTTALATITVDGGNANYAAENNALYNVGKTQLYTYAAAAAATSLTLPSTLTIIGANALENATNLQSVLIPASVATINEYAFDGCTALSKVVMLPTTADVPGTNAFRNNAASRKIYVLASRESFYEGSWTAYASDIEPFTYRLVKQEGETGNTTAALTSEGGTYTGSDFTPSATVTVKAAKDLALYSGDTSLGYNYQFASDTPLTLTTNYTMTYKKGEAAYAATKPRDCGTYSVKVTGTGDYSGEVELANSFEVTQKTLTVTADNKTVTYGDAVPTYSVTYSGFAGEETSDVVTGDLTYSCTYAQYSNVGDYTITPVVTGLSATNYSFTPAAGMLTVNKKDITIDGITASNKVYDKTTTATLAYDAINWSACGQVNSDELSVTATGAFADYNVGDGKTVTISGITLGGDKAGNYKLAASGQQTSTTASITAKEVTVAGITANNKEYDGTTDATLVLTGATFDGMVAGDILSVAGATGAFVDANVADGKSVNITGITLGGSSATNYQLSSTSGATTANITAKQIGLSWENLEFDCDGNEHKPTATATGLIAGDEENVTVTVTGGQSAVGSYTATASGLTGTAAGNYSLPAATMQAFTIVRALGISFDVDNNREWATYYAAEKLALPANVNAYIVTGLSGHEVTTTQISFIPQGQGVLLHYTGTGTASSFKASAYAGENTDYSATNKLLGSTTAIDNLPAGSFILYNNAFVLAEGANLAANRCYLPSNFAAGAGARRLTITIGGGNEGTTGVNELKHELSVDETWYDLNGRKLDGMPRKRGVYIMNGKKVVIK